MATIIKPKSIYFGQLNNAEYTYFAGQIAGRITKDTVEALHVPEAAFESYKTGYDKMVDLVAQSRVAGETAEIGEVDAEEDSLLVYLNAAIRTAKSSSVAAKKAAGTALYNATKPYVGVQRLPQRQQVQKVEGLLLDLAKEDLAAHLETVGLKEEVESLRKLNARYQTLLESRANSQVANSMEASKSIRTEMDELYDEMITTIFAFSVAVPSETLTEFIVFLNKLVADTTTAYNQRTAQSGKSAGKTAAK